jgi:hypothetical protein
MVVKMSMVFFWVVTPRELVGRYQCFREIYSLHLQGSHGVTTQKTNIGPNIALLHILSNLFFRAFGSTVTLALPTRHNCEMSVFVRLHVSTVLSHHQVCKLKKVAAPFLHYKVFFFLLKYLKSLKTYTLSPFCRRCFDSVLVVYYSCFRCFGCRVRLQKQIICV